MKNSNTIAVAKSSLVQKVKPTNLSVGLSFEELYKKKDYKGAASYLLQNKQQLNSGIFHYNLGTVYSKIGDYPAARFHLEKSIKEGYINSSSLNNLTYVKSQLQVDDISTSSSFPDQFMNTVLSVPPAAYVSLSLVLLLIGMFLIKSKKIVKKLNMAFILIIIILPLTFSQFYLHKVNYAITFHEASLYEGPSKIFTEKGKIQPGSKIILGDYKEGWFYVKFPISLTGWVNKDQIGLY